MRSGTTGSPPSGDRAGGSPSGIMYSAMKRCRSCAPPSAKRIGPRVSAIGIRQSVIRGSSATIRATVQSGLARLPEHLAERLPAALPIARGLQPPRQMIGMAHLRQQTLKGIEPRIGCSAAGLACRIDQRRGRLSWSAKCDGATAFPRTCRCVAPTAGRATSAACPPWDGSYSAVKSVPMPPP